MSRGVPDKIGGRYIQTSPVLKRLRYMYTSASVSYHFWIYIHGCSLILGAKHFYSKLKKGACLLNHLWIHAGARLNSMCGFETAKEKIIAKHLILSTRYISGYITSLYTCLHRGIYIVRFRTLSEMQSFKELNFLCSRIINQQKRDFN